MKTIVSFSGGRTSAYMLKRMLDRGDDVLPIFANTGKEREETLQFVQDCSINFGIEVVWIELDRLDDKDSFKIVNFETASRNGEPFAAIIDAVGMVPNPVFRFCTDRLKITPIRKYLKSRFDITQLQLAIGIRIDERHRGQKQNAKYPKTIYPLIELEISKQDVDAYWKGSHFDLGIDSNQGNCDLCFLKSRGKLVHIIKNNPALADWWIDMEDAKGDMFKRPYSYKDLVTMSKAALLFETDDSAGIDCFCTD